MTKRNVAPCDTESEQYLVGKRMGVGTRAPGAGGRRLHRVDDSALYGNAVQDALCRAVYHGY